MRTRWIVLLSILLVGGAALALRVMRPKRVTVALAERGSAIDAVYASGTVEAIERIELKARIGGPLGDLLVREGDSVRAGQLVARIDAPSLGFDVARGVAELEGATLRARTAPAIAQLHAQADVLRVQIAQARLDRARAERLASAEAIAPQDLDRAGTALNSLEAQLRANLALQRDARIQLDTDAARQRASLSALAARADDREVRSPMDGVVLARLVERGQTVSQNQSLLRIGDVRRLQIEAQVDESDVARIRDGMEAAVRFYSYPARVFAARVTRILPDADRDRKSFQVDLELGSPPEGLRPGMTAEVNVITVRHDGVVLTSPTAVHDASVWVVDRSGRVHTRHVETGVRDLLRVEITHGLSPGDRVVQSDVAGLREGMRVDATVVSLPRSLPTPGAQPAVTP